VYPFFSANFLLSFADLALGNLGHSFLDAAAEGEGRNGKA